MMKKKILFICTGNSIRSQMAHALFDKMTDNQHEVYSAGVRPVGVHNLTQKVMGKINISMEGYKSNHVSEYKDVYFDYIFVFCEIASLGLPQYKGNYKMIKMFIDDPIRIIGSDKRKEKAFIFTRNLIEQKLEEFIEKYL